MAPIKLERIISVSSEDPAHPAENLLKQDYSGQKWKCKSAGEKQITVVLQLEKASVISSVDVGNWGSAFIEILVAKSSQLDEFKVLVAASTLMSPQDAKLGTNLTGVRFFKVDSVPGERWDRVRVVCSQPYNRLLQYGLSFLVFHSAEPVLPAANLASTSPLGRFHLKPTTDSPAICTGSLFARRNQVPPELTGAGEIRAASVVATTSREVPPQCRLQGRPSQGSSSGGDSSLLPSSLPKEKEIKTPKRRVNTPRRGRDGVDRKKGGGCSWMERPRKGSGGATERRVKRPFGRLLEGVVLSISGLQNPLRSELRSKALAMGAKYRPDWGPTSTHLLCAFPNTPKFQQVLGQGKIVTKEWIESCHARRMRLPWRRFALHPPDKRVPESEDEVWEAVEGEASGGDGRRRANSPSSSGEDTEEEIHRVRQVQMQKQKVQLKNGMAGKAGEKEKKKQVGPVTAPSAGDVYEMDTDTEEAGPTPGVSDVYDVDTETEEGAGRGEATIPRHLYLPALPSLLDGMSFCLDEQLTEEEMRSLKRYIVANKGTLIEDISEDAQVEYFISESSSNVQRMRVRCPQVTGVRPEWVWRTHDEGRLLPVGPFQL